MATPVRVRFAPSPTGLLHVGGVRSALFNWLWARHNGGVFVLRLEDTDQARLVPEAPEQIQSSLDLLGLTPDEGPAAGGEFGPYVQSQRLDLYQQHSKQLAEKGSLYPCWCSPERLTELRQQAQASGQAFKYDRYCLQPDHQKSLDEPHVLRFKVPDQPATVEWDDAVRGHQAVAIKEIDDFVAVKSDGYPTYHFANVVDDHLMTISHVLRADEWLPSTPKHLLLFAAFDWQPPVYAHLPAILGPDGKKKLSKRDGAQAVGDYLAQGYLPEALVSFLATLGWNDGTTQEIYTSDELIKVFTLERIQKSPAKFDLERLNWINGTLIRQLGPQQLLERSQDFWPPEAKDADEAYRLRVLGLVQERLKYLAELPELTDFFFADPEFDPALLKDWSADEAKQQLEAVAKLLADTTWTEATLEAALRSHTEQTGLGTGRLFGLIRLAITGKTAAPGLFETLAALGKDVSLRRLKAALKRLS